MAEMSSTAVATPPIAAFALAGVADWQTVVMVGIALIVSLYRIVDADPPLPTRKALASVMMGLVFTLVFAPIAGIWIADRFALSEVHAVMVATIVVSIGWLKLYKLVELNIVDLVLKVLLRTLKALFGVK